MPSPTALRVAHLDEVFGLRHAVLRPGRPVESAVFAGDGLADTFHLVAAAGERIVGVVTLSPARADDLPDATAAWQLRGMAVAEPYRGRGIGAALGAEAVAHVWARGGDLVWCNARLAAQTLYARLGFVPVGTVFEIADVGPHQRMALRRTGPS